MYGEQGETHSLGYLESSAAAIQPSFVPTPLQPAMGTGFVPLGEPPIEGGDENWLSSWESEEVDMDISMQVQELQLGSPMPSTSNSATGGREVHACPQCHIICSRKDAQIVTDKMVREE